MAACPSADWMLDFVEGRMAPEGMGELQQHVDGCAACFALLAALARGQSTLPGSNAAGAAAPWRPPERFEEYHLVRPIGRGAVGQVWCAHDERLDREVAVKFLAADARPDARERFLVEARAIARLSHPNIVAVYRAGDVAGRPYLVSELVRGQSLDRLARPVPWRRALDLAARLARGLACAHAAGVIHRDIKPANAIVTDGGDVKLLDFGLAKLLEHPEPEPANVHGTAPAPPPTLTQTGGLLGTPLYMAPEAWTAGRATTRMDVYSLCAVIYELCASRPPFSGATLVELRDRVLGAVPPRLSELCPGIDGELAAIVERGLARDPEERLASGVELASALERVRVRLTGAPHRITRAAAGAIAAAILGAVAIAAFVLARPAHDDPPPASGAAPVSANRRCSADRWCWDAAWVGRLDGVWGARPDDVWAVGERGVIRHFDGTRWTSVESSVAVDLHAVRGTAADDVWAVGQNGTILHWDGAAWRAIASGSSGVLSGVWPRARDDAWAVGLEGETLRWNGRAWRAVPSSTVLPLLRVDGSSEHDVWAVGAEGVAVHFDGTGWATVPTGAHEILTGVWAGGAAGTWAVGFHSTLLRWDGSRWTRMSLPDVVPPELRDDFPFNGITATGPHDVWLLPKRGPLLHHDGRAWTSHERDTVRELSWLWLDGKAGWAVGADGVAVRWDGTAWHRAAPGAEPDYVEWYATAGTGPADVWTVGYRSTTGNARAGHAAHFDGTVWRPVPLPATAPLRAVAAARTDDVWMVGDHGVVLHVDRGGVAEHPSGVDVTLRGAFVARRDRAWAVGDAGTILTWDGARWTSTASGSTADLDGVFATDAEHAWAAGDHGTLLRLDGGRWRPVPGPTDRRLWSLWGTGADDVWAVGDGGVVLHHDGRGWTIVPGGTSQRLLAISGSGPDDAWAVGEPWSESGCTILHWDGMTWTSLSHTPRAVLLGVFAASPIHAWAVGAEAAVLRFEPPRAR